MNKGKWIFCPVYGSKIRTMIREDTELKKNILVMWIPFTAFSIIAVSDTKTFIIVLPKPQKINIKNSEYIAHIFRAENNPCFILSVFPAPIFCPV